MTTARHAAALLLIALGFALIAAVLMPAPASAVTVHSKAEVTLIKLAVGPGADTDADTRAGILAEADLICEGLTSGTPVTTMEAHAAAVGGMTLPAAHRFVEAAATRCAP